MQPVDWAEQVIRERAAKLEQYCDRILGCRVVVEAPQRSHRKGKHFHVRVDLRLPGAELVVNRDHTADAENGDLRAALRHAFDALRRQRQDFLRKRQGKVKTHEAPRLSPVAEPRPETSA